MEYSTTTNQIYPWFHYSISILFIQFYPIYLIHFLPLSSFHFNFSSIFNSNHIWSNNSIKVDYELIISIQFYSQWLWVDYINTIYSQSFWVDSFWYDKSNCCSNSFHSSFRMKKLVSVNQLIIFVNPLVRWNEIEWFDRYEWEYCNIKRCEIKNEYWVF